MSSFIGVYSSSTPGQDGAQNRRYWFVWDCGNEGYRVQVLDDACRPQGDTLAIDATAFTAGFTPEPTILAAPPEARDDGTAADLPADTRGAEVESALRADFAMLLMKVRRGEDVGATLKALEDIARVEKGIVPEHKYMFAEFGINLRKGKLPQTALEHAKRALILAPDDSHAHFNIARIYHALDRPAEAEQHLLTALKFAPDLEYAREFLAFIGRERRQKSAMARRERRR